MSDRTARVCSVDGCTRKFASRGMCTLHYGRWKSHGDPTASHATIICATCGVEFLKLAKGTANCKACQLARPCKVDDCPTPIGSKGAKGYCSKHYKRLRAHGSPESDFAPGVCKICSISFTRKMVNQSVCESCVFEKCSASGCDRPAHAKGYCQAHYRRALLGLDMEAPVRGPRPDCGADGCEKKNDSHGYCKMHWYRVRKYGTADLPERVNDRHCFASECGRRVYAKGLCATHYRRRVIRNEPDWERPIERRATYGPCAHQGCEGFGSVGDYCAAHRAERLAQSNRRSNYKHRLKRNAASRRYFHENKEYFRKKNRRWYSENAAQARATKRKWVAANIGKARAAYAANQARRYAQIRATRVERIDYMDIIRELGMVCHICGLEIPSMSDLHMDHVIPLSRGGHHVRSNLKPSHAFCNQSKGAKILN